MKFWIEVRNAAWEVLWNAAHCSKLIFYKFLDVPFIMATYGIQGGWGGGGGGEA
jgi:hypothetical protein